MATPFNYANGMTLFNCKKWCEFYFQDFFHEIVKNDEQRRFDIYLFDKVKDIDDSEEKLEDCFDLDYFSEFWGREFNIEIMTVKKREDKK